jgi:hypothetical protein
MVEVGEAAVVMQLNARWTEAKHGTKVLTPK